MEVYQINPNSCFLMEGLSSNVLEWFESNLVMLKIYCHLGTNSFHYLDIFSLKNKNKWSKGKF